VNTQLLSVDMTFNIEEDTREYIVGPFVEAEFPVRCVTLTTIGVSLSSTSNVGNWNPSMCCRHAGLGIPSHAPLMEIAFRNVGSCPVVLAESFRLAANSKGVRVEKWNRFSRSGILHRMNLSENNFFWRRLAVMAATSASRARIRLCPTSHSE
jgi:hypothetical protein